MMLQDVVWQECGTSNDTWCVLECCRQAGWDF